MINPSEITNFSLTKEQLEETILFMCCVAGKNARVTASRLDNFLKNGHEMLYGSFDHYSPFKMLRDLYFLIGEKDVALLLKKHGIGCYNYRARTFKELIESKIDLESCTIKELEEIFGIKEKTSRYFVLHTRPNSRCAVLDTHVKKFMVSRGIEFPSHQPRGRKYMELENKFVEMADDSGMSVADFDLKIWNSFAK